MIKTSAPPNRLYSFFIFLTVLIMIPLHARAVCPIDPNGTYIEAEDFSGSYNLDGDPDHKNEFDIEEHAGTNGGKVLVSGSSGRAKTIPENEVKTYEVTFPSAGTYYMWMRGKGFSDNQDSMFFTVDNDGWKAWNFGGQYNKYIWTGSMQVGSPNTIDILTAGTHTLKIAMREKDAIIDGFYLTTDKDKVPTDETVPSGAVSINPSAGCSGPFWTTDPGTLEPSCFAGYNAASLSFTLTNIGNGDDASSASVSSSQTWAVVADNTVPPLKKSESHAVTVSFETSGLAAGIHEAELTVTGGAYNSGLKIPVNLLVKKVPSTAACGEVPLYAENLVNPAIMVLLDNSGSMKKKMSIGNGKTRSRIAIAEEVLKEVFLDRSIAWGFGTWSGGSGSASNSDGSPDYYTDYRVGIHEHDAAHQTALQDKADDGYPSGATPLAPSMRGGLEYFKGNRQDDHYKEKYMKLSCQPRILVMVTDGLGNTGTNNNKIDAVVGDLIKEKISIVTVGFGLEDATQLDRIVKAMQTAGEKDSEDYLYHLHKENADGVAIPFMAQNRQAFIDAMNNIVSNVKAQIFHGASPAPTTSVDNGAILLNASFDASDWTGNITATKFNIFTGKLESTPYWETKDKMPAIINAFIHDAGAADAVSLYTDASIDGDHFLCKSMGDIINSTPAIIGSPPFFYNFDSYFDFKYNPDVRNRDEMAYVGANDGALHAFDLSDGREKWRFYPDSVKAKMAQAGEDPSKDMCSSSYCHMFLVDGSPEPADIFVTNKGWRTILTTGLGEGGSAFFALDVTYGEDFDATPRALFGGGTLDVKSRFLWEFTNADDAELGMATSWPAVARVPDMPNGTGWVTYLGSGAAETDLLQAEKEAYLFAVGSWDKKKVWIDKDNIHTYRTKLAAGTLKNDQPSPPRVIATQNDDFLADRIYAGNLYGNMYRLKDIGFEQNPVSELLYDAGKTDHKTPVTARPGFAHAGNGDIWLYFGTGRYQYTIDKFTRDQQYFFGLFDEKAARETPYKPADLVKMDALIIEAAHALNKDGELADLNGDGLTNSEDLRKYRTISCDAPDLNGNCNPGNASWALNLAIPDTGGSERVISQPLVIGGVVFFTTFIPDGDVCEGNGDTWLFALDWKTGSFVSDAVFDTNGDNKFDPSDTTVQDTHGEKKKIAGIYIGTGKPSGKLAIYNDILYPGTTDQPAQPVKVNLRKLRTRLKSWQQIFKQ